MAGNNWYDLKAGTAESFDDKKAGIGIYTMFTTPRK
jgi:hypothetical protein